MPNKCQQKIKLCPSDAILGKLNRWYSQFIASYLILNKIISLVNSYWVIIMGKQSSWEISYRVECERLEVFPRHGSQRHLHRLC